MLPCRRFAAVAALGSALACAGAPPPTAGPPTGAAESAPLADDASGLNATPVAAIWHVPPDSARAEEQLVELLRRARREGLGVSIAGARHTMGGHTIQPHGLVIDMLPFRRMRLEGDSILHVQAGATWEEIIPFLDARGRSVAIMQSNNSFSVGGTLSANAHGWQHDSPPVASSVRSFRLLLADGTLVRCSREENTELFSLVLGGYGLFGVILDVELRTVPNQRYKAKRHIVATRDYAAGYARLVNGQPDVAMAYGRLSVDPRTFLDEAILTVFHHRPAAGGRVPPLKEPVFVPITRAIFRRSVGSDRGKAQRWWIEKRLSGLSGLTAFSRNQLLHTSVEVYANRSPTTTDVLHEYFIPPEQIGAFVEELRSAVRRHRLDLLNVTIRNVYPDRDSFLRYARQEVFGFVILFVQPRTEEGEAAMQKMTRELIDSVLALGGTYYLPYRLHATPEQFHRAYPQAREFFELKRKYDPDELFQNRFYQAYGR